MKATTLSDVKKYAKSIGATVTDEKVGGTHSCTVDAPRYYIFTCDDIHFLYDETNRPWKPDYADVLTRMSYGIRLCDVPDCEWCNEV